MTQESTATSLQELNQRLAWQDEERRKSNRRLAELEQRVELQAREIVTRDQRIQSLEQELAGVKSRIGGLDQWDGKLAQVRKELAGLVDQEAQRRLEGQREADRLRQLENGNLAREIAAVRKELPVIPRIQADVEQRKAEEVRLSQSLAALQNRFVPIDNRLDALGNELGYLTEASRQTARQTAELQAQVLEVAKRVETYDARLESLAMSIMRYDATIQTIERSQTDVVRQMKTWVEQARVAEYDRNQRVAAWQDAFDAYKDDMARFHKEWSRVDDQHKEVRAQVQTIAEWRRQIELQQREAAEILRLDVQRLQARWADYLAENEKFWKTVEVETDQRLQTAERRQQQVQTQTLALEERIDQVRREKDTLQRVQAAQADAIKRIPTIWLEEVEKAIANDPERRRAPTPSPVPDEG